MSEGGVPEPGLPIIDPHHHLWHPHRPGYLVDEFQADIAGGHNVIATVYVECSVFYRRTGPAHLRSIGEAEFAAGMAAMGESGAIGPTRIATGFVGAADLTLGEAVDEVLDALTAASGGRLRGIRGATNWDADPAVNTGTRPLAPPGLLADPRFRAGVTRLAERKLVYDAWQYYPQLPEFCSLADAIPGATMVLNHCAGLLGIGPYAAAGNFGRWRKLVAEAARRPNVFMKLGGLAGGRNGFAFEKRATRATIDELLSVWRPYIESCIELFGPERCMFESNFPVDQVACDYTTLWSAFKTVAAQYSAPERSALFSATASRVYGIT